MLRTAERNQDVWDAYEQLFPILFHPGFRYIVGRIKRYCHEI